MLVAWNILFLKPFIEYIFITDYVELNGMLQFASRYCNYSYRYFMIILSETYMGKTRWAVAAALTGGVEVARGACYFDRCRRLGPLPPRTVSVGCSLWPRQRWESSCPTLCPSHSLQQNGQTMLQSLWENRAYEVEESVRFQIPQRCWGRFKFSAILCLVDWSIFTDVSEELIACSWTV